MLGLPKSTEISKQLPKKAIYAKFDLKPAQRDHFDEDISKLAIVNAISPTTIPALQKGTEVECIYVIEVSLKKINYDTKNIILLSKLIPQKILFALHFEDGIQLAIYHTRFICSNWKPEDSISIYLQGLTLDKVWDNLVITTGDIVIEGDNTLKEQIATDEARNKIFKEIEDLERKARMEKQPRKRLDMFEKIKALKEKI